MHSLCSDSHDDAELPLPFLPSFDVLSIGSIGKLQKAFHLLLLSLAPNFFSRYDLVVAKFKTDRRRPWRYALLYGF